VLRGPRVSGRTESRTAHAIARSYGVGYVLVLAPRQGAVDWLQVALAKPEDVHIRAVVRATEKGILVDLRRVCCTLGTRWLCRNVTSARCVQSTTTRSLVNNWRSAQVSRRAMRVCSRVASVRWRQHEVFQVDVRRLGVTEVSAGWGVECPPRRWRLVSLS
jgi:hypothetical protein